MGDDRRCVGVDRVDGQKNGQAQCYAAPRHRTKSRSLRKRSKAQKTGFGFSYSS